MRETNDRARSSPTGRRVNVTNFMKAAPCRRALCPPPQRSDHVTPTTGPSARACPHRRARRRCSATPTHHEDREHRRGSPRSTTGSSPRPAERAATHSVRPAAPALEGEACRRFFDATSSPTMVGSRMGVACSVWPHGLPGRRWVRGNGVRGRDGPLWTIDGVEVRANWENSRPSWFPVWCRGRSAAGRVVRQPQGLLVERQVTDDRRHSTWRGPRPDRSLPSLSSPTGIGEERGRSG